MTPSSGVVGSKQEEKFPPEGFFMASLVPKAELSYLTFAKLFLNISLVDPMQLAVHVYIVKG